MISWKSVSEVSEITEVDVGIVSHILKYEEINGIDIE